MIAMDFRVQMAKDVGQTVADAVAKCKNPVMEPKYNGWRCVVIRHEEGVDIYKPSRNSEPSKKYTGQLPELEADLMRLPVGTILDGELICMRHDGERWVEDFFQIHTCMRSNETTPEQRAGIKLIAFDIVGIDGLRADDLISKESLPGRRAALQEILENAGCAMVELTIQMEATQANHDQLVDMGFEGSMIKDQDKPYAFAKRGHGWFKVKWVRTIDCVVIDVIMDGKGQHEGKAGKMEVGQWRPAAEVEGGGHWLADIDGVQHALVKVCRVNCLNNAQRDEATEHPERFIGRVIEVKIYGWDTEGPRHPTPMRFRDGDKESTECLWSRT